MGDVIKRHDLLESIRPLVERLDSDGLAILEGWVQELKVERLRQAASGQDLPAPGGTLDAREEFRELLRRWDSET